MKVKPSQVWGFLGTLAGLFLLCFGGFVVSVGQADDSPGLGGLGLITMVIGAGLWLRLWLNRGK